MHDPTKPSDDPIADDIGCLEAIEAMTAYIDGELDDPESIAAFEHHMQHCRSCYSRAQMERALIARVKRAAEAPAPETLKLRIRKLMDRF